MGERFVGGVATTLTGATGITACGLNAGIGISERAARSKAQIPDSTLDDVFSDRDGLPRPYTTSLNPCRSVECKMLRSEQTLSKSNGSAGPICCSKVHSLLS